MTPLKESDLSKSFKALISLIATKLNEVIIYLKSEQEFVAVLSNNGSDAPIMTVLKNTFVLTDIPSIDRNLAGKYYILLPGANMSESNTSILLGSLINKQRSSVYYIDGSDSVEIQTFDNTGTMNDGQFYNTTVKIVKYSK